MNGTSRQADFSIFRLFEYLTNFAPVLLLICAVFVLDILSVFYFQKGISEIDFSYFFSFSNTHFFLMFFVAYGIIAAGLSCAFNIAIWRLYAHFSKSVSQNNKDMKTFETLQHTALITENKFLLDYINNKSKRWKHKDFFSKTTSALFISIIFNLAVTIFKDANTIINFILAIYFDNQSPLIILFTTALIIPVVFAIIAGFLNITIYDDNKIYYPDAKYKKIVEEAELLINSKK